MQAITVRELYPAPGRDLALENLYLHTPLHQIPRTTTPFIYANFVSSLDGRIALTNSDGRSVVPRILTTRSDWRLFLELQAQADCLITHGGYLRSLQRGELGNILQVARDDKSGQLAEFRRSRSMASQPTIIVVSATLDFAVPESVRNNKQRMIVLTTEYANRKAIDALRSDDIEVVVSDEKQVSARSVQRQLEQNTFTTAFLQTGPILLHSMLQHNLLSRCYLTTSLTMLGGQVFETLLNKPLSNFVELQPRTLYLCTGNTGQSGNNGTNAEPAQYFASYDIRKL